MADVSLVKFPSLHYFRGSSTISHQVLTHWGRDEMDAVFQTTYSNAVSWMTIYEFRLKFHWNLFLSVHYLNKCWPSSLMHICGNKGDELIWTVCWKFSIWYIDTETFVVSGKIYSISQEICTRFLLCCALLWLCIDWFSHIHQAYFTGTVAI